MKKTFILLIITLLVNISYSQVTTATTSAKNVRLQNIKSPAAAKAQYSTLQDLINVIISSGKISGGDLVDAGNGAVHVRPAEVIFKTTESKTGITSFMRVDSASNLSLTDTATNYVLAYYNGGNPIYVATTNPAPIFGFTNVIVGSVFREGNKLHIVDLSDNGFPSFFARQVLKEIEKNVARGFGFAEHISGANVDSINGRYIKISPGVFYTAYDRVTNQQFNSFTTLADSFSNYYRNGVGGWSKQTGQHQINNTQWDNGTGTLATLTVNRWGVRWIYLDFDAESVSSVFGRGDHVLLSNAQAEIIPAASTLPTFLSTFSTPIAKIMVQKDANTLIIESLFETP